MGLNAYIMRKDAYWQKYYRQLFGEGLLSMRMDKSCTGMLAHAIQIKRFLLRLAMNARHTQ